MFRLLGSVGLVLLLSACAGRAPQLAPLVLASDQGLTCEAIQAEARLNNEQMAALATEEDLKLGQNVVAGVAGFMIWPAWFALDFQDAAGKEGKALSRRNEYLATLADERCGPQPATTVAADLPLAPTLASTLASNAEISTGLVSY